jgi:anaerobic magnesium-protoporphyrin IX monomethyl ester cyclase
MKRGVLKMKILLLHPPENHMITTNLPSFVDEERGCYPPLGLMYVAAYLKKYSDHKILFYDSIAEETGYKYMEKLVKKVTPDVVGIQCVTFTMIDVMKTIRIVKKANPNIKIILGGPHVNIYPYETMAIKGVDYIVLGEGEAPFLDLINNMHDPKKLAKVKGIVFRKKGKVINTGNRELIQDLDTLPHPPRQMTNYKKYYSLIASHSPITTMFTSRGCPYKCIFCDRPHLGKNFRYRSANNVVSELEQISKLGIKEVFIYDDTFTVNRERVVKICKEILRRKIKVNWDVRARVNTVDYPLLKLMKKAGCVRIHYGVESGSQRVLNVLRKGITIQQVKKAFKYSRKLGITTLGYFIIGSPTETRKEIMRSIRFAKELKADFVHFAVMTPFPATELYRLGLQNGVLKNDFWREFAKNPTEDFVPQHWEENFTKDELVEMMKFAYKSFYLRPDYIIKRLFKVRSVYEILKKGKVALRLFKY